MMQMMFMTKPASIMSVKQFHDSERHVKYFSVFAPCLSEVVLSDLFTIDGCMAPIQRKITQIQ
jgi:hypothetical protein